MENRTNLNAEFVEPRLLRYFAVVAEEGSLRKAAERLFISQPPLTRQIRQLEEALGVALFTRHSKGLALTEEGRDVLAIVRPLLDMQSQTMERLRRVSRSGKSRMRVGLTTAFEQGTFIRLEASLREAFGNSLRLTRAASPKLVGEVRKGRLDAAFVALPLDAPGMDVCAVGYAEPLAAVLPGGWSMAGTGGAAPLSSFSGRPLFWYARDANIAFFDYTRAVFAHAGFRPVFMEEPEEHDVLLSRIAAGEGMGLLPTSFAAIRRDGVVFAPLREGGMLRVELGLVTRAGSSALRDRLISSWRPPATPQAFSQERT